MTPSEPPSSSSSSNSNSNSSSSITLTELALLNWPPSTTLTPKVPVGSSACPLASCQNRLDSSTVQFSHFQEGSSEQFTNYYFFLTREGEEDRQKRGGRWTKEEEEEEEEGKQQKWRENWKKEEENPKKERKKERGEEKEGNGNLRWLVTCDARITRRRYVLVCWRQRCTWLFWPRGSHTVIATISYSKWINPSISIRRKATQTRKERKWINNNGQVGDRFPLRTTPKPMLIHLNANNDRDFLGFLCSYWLVGEAVAGFLDGDHVGNHVIVHVQPVTFGHCHNFLRHQHSLAPNFRIKMPMEISQPRHSSSSSKSIDSVGTIWRPATNPMAQMEQNSFDWLNRIIPPFCFSLQTQVGVDRNRRGHSGSLPHFPKIITIKPIQSKTNVYFFWNRSRGANISSIDISNKQKMMMK